MSKDYSVKITYVVQFTASGPTQAEERGQDIADALAMFFTMKGKKWVGDMEQESVEIESQED